MAFISVSIICILLTIVYILPEIKGHGRLIDPPSRASMWRYGFELPQSDYDDNQGYCGGQQQLWNRFGGICGVCGDARYPLPRAHERGGRYYTGIVVKRYHEGDVIEVTTQITANHRGWYEFRLCAYDDPATDELEYDGSGNFVEVSNKCLDKHLLELENGGTRWYLPAPYKVGLYTVKVKLPSGLSCNNCLFQWKWNCANSWGKEHGGKSCIGCGKQEQFYACSDISIVPRSGRKPMFTWSPPQPHVTRRPQNITPKPKPTHRPKPDISRSKPSTPWPKPMPPQQHPEGDRRRPKPTENPTNKPREFPFIPKFTYTPQFTRPKLPPVPSGRIPIPPYFTPIRPHFPAWIPTQQPSWPWFTPRPQPETTRKSETSSSVGTPSSKFPKDDKSTKPQSQATNKPTESFKFWNWLSDRFLPVTKPSVFVVTTTVSPDAPWWAKLPSSNKSIQWWNIISKFQGKSRVTTTAMPLPWWIKKAKPTQDLLPKFFNEKGEAVDGEKELNGLSATASKDKPEMDTREYTLPVEVTKHRKRICTPAGSLIQEANMWIWCDVNCSNSKHCPKTHCICSS